MKEFSEMKLSELIGAEPNHDENTEEWNKWCKTVGKYIESFLRHCKIVTSL